MIIEHPWLGISKKTLVLYFNFGRMFSHSTSRKHALIGMCFVRANVEETRSSSSNHLFTTFKFGELVGCISVEDKSAVNKLWKGCQGQSVDCPLLSIFFSSLRLNFSDALLLWIVRLLFDPACVPSHGLMYVARRHSWHTVALPKANASWNSTSVLITYHPL